MVVRSFHLAIGITATGLAVLGVVLPLLPTTPFLLVAAWAFARSSPRLEAWLLGHARFGPLVADWRAEGAVGRRARRVAVAVMAATWGLGLVFGLSGRILALQGAVFVPRSGFLWTRPLPTREVAESGGRP